MRQENYFVGAGRTAFSSTPQCLLPSHYDRDRNTDYYPPIIHPTPTEPDRDITNVPRGTLQLPSDIEARLHEPRPKSAERALVAERGFAPPHAEILH